ncbi:hypothetical protein BDV29DRAFT_185223 [Aspergillus leporis]|uniref:Uncharacterized protein n=1 Tax=Aspergillus leporis TaxID=41062 RepID=A0A5N5WL33_9EURO|nr:hypothetical protein BDV29DRAFT_185223 [Aspergillus leporis]
MEDVECLTRSPMWVKMLGADATLKRRGYPIIVHQIKAKIIGLDNPAKHQRALAQRLLAANATRLNAELRGSNLPTHTWTGPSPFNH